MIESTLPWQAKRTAQTIFHDVVESKHALLCRVSLDVLAQLITTLKLADLTMGTSKEQQEQEKLSVAMR